MAYSVSTQQMEAMSPQQRQEAIGKLARGAFGSANGGKGRIDARIDEFERQYGFSSRELMERLMAGEISETGDVSEWLWLLNFRKNRVS